ncbi:MAG: adenosylmethionine decarboxylase, partial [Rhodobacterales bacterium]|nr:adenosylmethionine decarboxylase [Rhodobacterales bacterium]
MTGSNLFQLGIGLETGAQAEDHRSDTAATRDIFDDSRDDHFIRRDGKVFAGTHLIIEVVNGHGLDDETRIQQAFRDSVE